MFDFNLFSIGSKQIERYVKKMAKIIGESLELLCSIYILRRKPVTSCFSKSGMLRLLFVFSLSVIFLWLLAGGILSMGFIRLNMFQEMKGALPLVLKAIIEYWPIAIIFWLFAQRQVHFARNMIMITLVVFCLFPYNLFVEVLSVQFGFPAAENLGSMGMAAYIAEMESRGIAPQFHWFRFFLLSAGQVWWLLAVIFFMGDLNKMRWSRSIAAAVVAWPLFLCWSGLVNGIDLMKFLAGKPWG